MNKKNKFFICNAVMAQWEDFLNEMYFKIDWPGSFAGPSKLKQILKENGYDVKYDDILQWTQNQNAYSLLKPVRYRFKRNRVITTGIDNLWDGDLADVQNIKIHNDGYSYLLLLIDVFSRYIWIEPVKSKSKNDMYRAFTELFARTERRPSKLRTDKGTEFTNKTVKLYLKSIGIKWYTTKNETKANYAERAIRTIKGLLYRYFIHNNTKRYVEVLQDIVKNYNNRPHRSLLSKTPSSVNGNNETMLWKRMYVDTVKHVKHKKYKFQVGNQVRISHLKYVFQRDWHQKWTEEYFVVTQRLRKGKKNLYRLKDLLDEEIDGLFYESELHRIQKPEKNVTRVDKVVRRRTRKGKREVLVKWSGWPSKFNAWIEADSVKTY